MSGLRVRRQTTHAGGARHGEYSVHGDRHPEREGDPTILVYQGKQEEAPVDLGPENLAKQTLLSFLRDARTTILDRANALPGSRASTELYVRYRQIESRALQQGNAGLWSQALSQFKNDYTLLLSAAPTGAAEPIGRGARGIGATEVCRYCKGVGCAACRGQQFLEDFWGLLNRAKQAIRSGDEREAQVFVQRARQALGRLEPQHVGAATTALQDVSREVAASSGGGIDGRVVRRGQGVKDAQSDVVVRDIAQQQRNLGDAITQMDKDRLNGYEVDYGPLQDRWLFVYKLIRQSVDRGQLAADDIDNLNAYQIRLRQKLGKSTSDDSAVHAQLTTELGSIANSMRKLGVPVGAPQSGRETVAPPLVDPTRFMDCAKSLLSGGATVRDVWDKCLDDSLKTGVKIGGALLGAYVGFRVYKAVK